jgi:hypothetical protein
MLHHVSAVNYSHPQGATSVEDVQHVIQVAKYKCKIFIHISVIP